MLTSGADTDLREPSDIDEQTPELLPLQDRLGLWCAMFPGCGVLILGLLVASAVALFRRRG